MTRIIPVSDIATLGERVGKIAVSATEPAEPQVVEIFQLFTEPGSVFTCRCGEEKFRRITCSLFRCVECGGGWQSGHSPAKRLVIVEKGGVS